MGSSCSMTFDQPVLPLPLHRKCKPRQSIASEIPTTTITSATTTTTTMMHQGDPTTIPSIITVAAFGNTDIISGRETPLTVGNNDIETLTTVMPGGFPMGLLPEYHYNNDDAESEYYVDTESEATGGVDCELHRHQRNASGTDSAVVAFIHGLRGTSLGSLPATSQDVSTLFASPSISGCLRQGGGAVG